MIMFYKGQITFLLFVFSFTVVSYALSVAVFNFFICVSSCVQLTAFLFIPSFDLCFYFMHELKSCREKPVAQCGLMVVELWKEFMELWKKTQTAFDKGCLCCPVKSS